MYFVVFKTIKYLPLCYNSQDSRVGFMFSVTGTDFNRHLNTFLFFAPIFDTQTSSQNHQQEKIDYKKEQGSNQKKSLTHPEFHQKHNEFRHIQILNVYTSMDKFPCLFEHNTLEKSF